MRIISRNPFVVQVSSFDLALTIPANIRGRNPFVVQVSSFYIGIENKHPLKHGRNPFVVQVSSFAENLAKQMGIPLETS